MFKPAFALLCVVVLPVMIRTEEVAGQSPVVPVSQHGTEKRHAEKVAAAKASDHYLLMIGDSLTHNFDKPKEKDGVNPTL
jgi:hypothetical protein